MKGLPNFPLLFSQVGRYLKEAKADGPKQQRDLKTAQKAFDTITKTIYATRAGIACCPPHIIITPYR
jgi:hypothetical protein